MFWIWFFIVFALYVTVVLLLEKGLNKLFNVTKQKVSDTDGKMVDRWFRVIMVIVSLSVLIFYIVPLMKDFKENVNVIMWYWLIHFGVIFFFQVFMEWKYLKPSKQYLTSLIIIVIILISYFVFYRFFISFVLK